MHWLRIDRYYSSEDTFESDLDKKEEYFWFGEKVINEFGDMEDPQQIPR